MNSPFNFKVVGKGEKKRKKQTTTRNKYTAKQNNRNYSRAGKLGNKGKWRA